MVVRSIEVTSMSPRQPRSAKPRAARARAAGGDSQKRGETLTVRLDAFAWHALEEESAKQEMTPEELARHAVLYYLADLDSGRLARHVPGERASRRAAARRASDAGA
jgi:hypothetical protein